jgi:hypothetical protein
MNGLNLKAVFESRGEGKGRQESLYRLRIMKGSSVFLMRSSSYYINVLRDAA